MFFASFPVSNFLRHYFVFISPSTHLHYCQIFLFYIYCLHSSLFLSYISITGEVQYNIAGFAEKNRDSTNNDMRELLAKSQNKLLR